MLPRTLLRCARPVAAGAQMRWSSTKSWQLNGSGGFTGTADLCDQDTHSELAYPTAALFRDYGARVQFRGTVTTVKCYHDNSLVKEAVAEPGTGRVLVIDGAGSLERAMVGDMIAEKAQKNGWEGFIVFGCVRDSAALAQLDIGVKALGTCPRKTDKLGQGLRDVPVVFAGQTFEPGQMVVADADGVVLFPQGAKFE